MSAYIGRFAPSPSGPLHAGSALAAIASWLDARAANGRWLLRIEDIDTPRCKPEHAQRILDDLIDLGLEWDGTVAYQSQRIERYEEVFAQLKAEGNAFPCACSRQALKRAQNRPGEPIYPGSCRNGLPAGQTGRTWRFRIHGNGIEFVDRLFGPQQQQVSDQCGDFVIKRADQLFAYQLVVVVDDIDAGINQIVRGVDILPSTGRQIQLYQALKQTPPEYLHLPVLVDERGSKLSKQTGALPIDTKQAEALWRACLQALGQEVPQGTMQEIRDAAVKNWQSSRIPQCPQLSAGTIPV